MKKLMVISDIHGSIGQLKKAIDIFDKGGYTSLVILGDLYYHGPRNPLPEKYSPKERYELLNQYKDKIYCVKGNCDSEVDQMVSEFKLNDSLSLSFNDITIYCDHGHKYGPDNPPKGLYNVYLFGHYHVIHHRLHKGMYLLSPGSISLPKDDNYAYLSICENGEVKFNDINTNELIFELNILH